MGCDLKWQPIKTAPKDGGYYWLGNPNNIRIGFWMEGSHQEHHGSKSGGWKDQSRSEHRGPSDLRFKPTHWLPLPEPPP